MRKALTIQCFFIYLFKQSLIKQPPELEQIFCPVRETNRTHSTEAMWQIADTDRAKRNY